MKPRFFLPKFLLLGLSIAVLEGIALWLLLFVPPDIIPCASVLVVAIVSLTLCKELINWVVVFIPRWEQEVDQIIAAYGR